MDLPENWETMSNGELKKLPRELALEIIACRRTKEPLVFLSNRDPALAIKDIKPDNCKGAEQYVWRKMGAWIGSGQQWAPIRDINKKQAERYQNLRQKIIEGDDNAVFDLIRHDATAIGDELVQARISVWQDQVDSEKPEERRRGRWKLQKIGESLVPDKRGARKNSVGEPEEVLKYFWDQEWRWFHLLGYLLSGDLLDKTFNKEIEEKVKSLGIDFQLFKKLMDSHIKNEVEPNSKSIAAYLTGLKFGLDETTILRMLNKIS